LAWFGLLVLPIEVSRVPSEFRQILFTNNEVIEALYEYNQVVRGKLPPGMIVSCTPVAEEKVAVRLKLVDQASGGAKVASLAPELVAAALLRYCFNHYIPIPRNAAKSIQVHGDRISLDVRIRGRMKQSDPAGSAVAGQVPPER
jgi:hypothetical protein